MAHCRSCTCELVESRIDYLYKTWQNIKYRTTNVKSKDYKNYGGRGISMYEKWHNNFYEFQAYILNELGERMAGCSLDRIDNDGNYEPGNIRWSTFKDQISNRRKPSNPWTEGGKRFSQRRKNT